MSWFFDDDFCCLGIERGRKASEYLNMHVYLRSTLSFATAAMCVSVYAQSATLVASYQGKEVGTATYAVGVLPSGQVTKSLSVKLTVEGSVFETRATAHISSRGQTLYRFEYAALGGKPRTDLKILIDSKGATLIDNLTGKKTLFPTPASPSSRDMSDLWFLTTKPKIGDKVVSSGISSLAGWQKTTTTYTGDTPVKVGGNSILGHIIEHVDAGGSYSRVVDDHGIPLQFTLPKVPGLVFTRK